MTEQLKVIGGRRSHDTLRRVLASRPPVRVLDVPAGTGTLAHFLRERGWEVHCADIDPGNFEAEGFPFTQVDLNRSLPIEDESFDAVVCANGIHRLFNPDGAIAEFYRILRPGGRLHINVNNYAAINKRLRFLFTGSITHTINESRYRQTIDEPEACVRQHLFFPRLANAMEAAGFRILDLQPSGVRVSQRLLAPIAWAVRFSTLFLSPRNKRRSRVAATNGPAICPGGKYLYVEAVKPGP